MMQIIYNGIDITASVQPTMVRITDYAGGRPDNLLLIFADSEGIWSNWKPAKNDTLQVKEAGFDTGVMFIDMISQSAGSFALAALSIPQSCKSARSQGWENVRLMEIATQIAARHGFSVQTYGIVNHLYERVDQQEEADFTFLAERCQLEGYAFKINNRSMVLYAEAMQEQKAPDSALAIIRQTEINGGFEFVDKSTDVYGKCIVQSQTPGGFIVGECSAPEINGPTLKRNTFATNHAEANRWAKGILRSYNKHAITGNMTVNLNTNYAAGITVRVIETGMFDGVFFVDRLTHDLINNQTKLLLRRPLEGY
ncbi:MAG: hypothetical protein K6T85_01795 [Gorillibacterium sp.]|nr:hypothetical protein [Gorillibacterium sp.]